MASEFEATFYAACFVWIVSFDTCASQFSGWEEYIASWQTEQWATRMYPFGEKYFDHIATSSDGTDAEIKFSLPYYGGFYSAAYVSTEGHIELSNTVPATHTPKAPNTFWPNENYPQTGDVPFISPYYAQFEMTNLPDDSGRLYWRRVDPGEETDPARIDVALNLLAWLSKEVRQYVVGSEDFVADYALMATWSEATFYACINTNCPTNTVQAAVVTNQLDTYVIYNYYELTWIGSLKQGYDPETGLICQGDCVPAQAGFNAGRARAFYSLPFSGTDEVLRLAETSGTGIAGRFIYKVDSFNIIRGGCSNISDIDPVDWPLQFSPSHGSMLGGQLVYVSGPCFLSYLTVHCMFGDVIVEGWLLDGDYTRAACVTPFVQYKGNTMVKVSTNKGITWPYTGWFDFDAPDEASEVVTLDFLDQWYNKSAQQLSFHWEPSDLEDSYEKTTNTTPTFTVDIILCTYTETVLANGTLGQINEVHIIGENIPNSGMYTFNVEEHQCSDVSECDWSIPLPAGLIEIKRTDTASKTRKIWSHPFPLGWYGNSIWNVWHGDSWAEQFCSWWFDAEINNMTWLTNLEPCPVTESQALADSGRFLWNPCNSSSPTICLFHREMSCYEQLTPKAKEWPAVSQCCYSDNGYLLYAADSGDGAGSFSAKVNRLGDKKAAYGKVPLLSHFIWDDVFMILCCNWTADPKYCQDMYARVRPIPDASGYKTPKSTTAFGDPHFRTFDGVDYTFNGRGEYWLLRVIDMDEDLDNIALQARLEKPSPDTWGEVKATLITSVVMQEGYADDMTVPTIEVQMAEPEATVSQMLLVNGQPQDFTMEHNRKMDLPYRENSRLIIITNNEVKSEAENTQSNFSITFQSGIMVQVARVDGAMHVICSLPSRYKGQTAGLFGLWSDNKDDDLTTPGGEPIDYTRGNEFIHYNFGEKWVLTDAESRFTYRGSLKSSDYHHPEFVPYFTEPVLPPNSTLTEHDVDEACGTNFVCRFDYKTTLSRDLAVTSSDIQRWTSEIADMSQPVPVCPYIDVPHSRREVTSYAAGGTLTFTGCADEYTLQGHTVYTCIAQNSTAFWNPTPDTVCKANSEIAAEQQQKAIMIAVPICCVVAAAGLTVGGYFLYKHKKKNKGGEAAPRSNQFSYSSGYGTGPASQRTESRQNVEPDLMSQWMKQSSTLAGGADLGNGYTNHSLQLSHDNNALSPNGMNGTQAISRTPDPEYSEIIRHRMPNNDEFGSSEFQTTGSFSTISNSFRRHDQAYSNHEMPLQDNEFHEAGLSPARQADASQVQAVQFQLAAAELQLHDVEEVNQSAFQSEPDLIQLGSSTNSIVEGGELQATANQTRLSQSLQSLTRPKQDEIVRTDLISSRGYVNHAASLASLNRVASSPSLAPFNPGSRQASQVSVTYDGGHDNVAMTTAEYEEAKPPSKFAAYAASFGADTVV